MRSNLIHNFCWDDSCKIGAHVSLCSLTLILNISISNFNEKPATIQVLKIDHQFNVVDWENYFSTWAIVVSWKTKSNLLNWGQNSIWKLLLGISVLQRMESMYFYVNNCFLFFLTEIHSHRMIRNHLRCYNLKGCCFTVLFSFCAKCSTMQICRTTKKIILRKFRHVTYVRWMEKTIRWKQINNSSSHSYGIYDVYIMIYEKPATDGVNLFWNGERERNGERDKK